MSGAAARGPTPLYGEVVLVRDAPHMFLWREGDRAFVLQLGWMVLRDVWIVACRRPAADACTTLSGFDA